MFSTKNDEVVQGRQEHGMLRLRRKNSDQSYMLPVSSFDAARDSAGALGRELDSQNGLRLDGGRPDWFGIMPCAEIGIGRATLIAETGASAALRRFLSRILGWRSDQRATVELALRSVFMAATRQVALILSGQDELVALAHTLHRHAIGGDRPFIVSDPGRQNVKASVCSTANIQSAMAAVEAASGGSLCVSETRLPPDFGKALERLRDPATRVQLIFCSPEYRRGGAFIASTIEIPPLAKRSNELMRIVEEYEVDAQVELGEPGTGVTRTDRDWVLAHEATTLVSIERATRRLMALRTSRSVNHAAMRLGMSHSALSRWFTRRGRSLPTR